MKHLHRFARQAAALVLALVLCLTLAAPSALAATTIGGADTTLIPAEEENCLSWLFGSGDTITMPYLNIKGQGLRRNVTLDLVDCLVGITYTELGSIGSYVSASAAQQAWKAQAVAVHSYLEYQKQYGSSANALIYTPVEDIPSSARSAIRKAVEAVKDPYLQRQRLRRGVVGQCRLQHPDRRLRHLFQSGRLGHRCALSAERGEPL